jgi:hypothetical protein
MTTAIVAAATFARGIYLSEASVDQYPLHLPIRKGAHGARAPRLRIIGWYLDLITYHVALRKYCEDKGFKDVIRLAEETRKREGGSRGNSHDSRRGTRG